MTRKEIKALRDSCFESMAAMMPNVNRDGTQTAVHADFVALMSMVHATCCRQLDAREEIMEHDETQEKCLQLAKALGQAEKALEHCHGSEKIAAVRTVLKETCQSLFDLAGE